MNEFLTRAQIDKKFDSEWVLLENPETDKYNNVLGGVVLRHSKNRSEVYRKLAESQAKSFAVLYIGKMPKDTVIIL